MEMSSAAVFLAASILYTLGLIIILAGIVIVNNLLNKYWKPVSIFTKDSWFINPPMPEEKDGKDLGSTTR